MEVPAGAVTCSNCGGTVVAKPAPPGFPPSTGQAPSSSVGGAPPGAYAPLPQFMSSPATGYRSSNTGRNVAIVIGVVVVLVVAGAVGSALLVFNAARGGGSGGASLENPMPIALNQPVAGTIAGSGDRPVYELSLPAPATVTISVSAGFDNYLELYRATEASPFLEDDDSGPDLNAMISTYLPAGTYRILVRPFGSGTGPFTLAVTGMQVGGVPGPGVPPTGGPPFPGGGPPGTGMGVPSPVAPAVHQAMVSGTSGPSPVQAGVPCTVEITPSMDVYNCRVRVTCGTQMIYGVGNGGYNSCVVAPAGSGQTVEAHDTRPSGEDGDPRVDVQTSTGQVVVSDGVGPAMWTVTVQIGAPGGAGPASAT